jgi:hypothetical protein
MKKLIIIPILLSFCIQKTLAQQRTVEKSFTVQSDQKVVLNLKFGETIAVEAWDKNEVSFKADIEINQGKLNDALVLDFIEQNEILEISASYDEEKLKAGRRQDCPEHYSSYYRKSENKEGYVICSEIKYTLFVPANNDIAIETISGNIELVDLGGPIRAKSISGFVDISWPSAKAANFSMETVSGEAYTDIDELQFTNKKDHIPLVGYEIKANIGSGGPAVSLESVSGNIYLREGKG